MPERLTPLVQAAICDAMIGAMPDMNLAGRAAALACGDGAPSAGGPAKASASHMTLKLRLRYVRR
jgi:hypothetical protein